MKQDTLQTGKGEFKQTLKRNICVGDILINKSYSQGVHFITNTRIKHGVRSCDLTLLKIYFLPSEGDSKYTIFTSLLLRSSQIHSVRCSTHQLWCSRELHCLCVHRRITSTQIWSETEPWLKMNTYSTLFE